MGGPYISAKELLSAPTGIEWSSVAGKTATPAQRDAEIQRIIRRASARVNNCTNQQLWATKEVVPPLEVPSRFVAYRNGIITVYVSNFPIISVDSVRFSADGMNYSLVPGIISFRSGPGMLPDFFKLNVNGGVSSQPYVSSYFGWLEVTYTSGFANGVLTSNALAGAQSVYIDDPTGILPGDTLTICDDDLQEDVQIATDYAGSQLLPLASPLLFAHTAGTAISEIPDDIKEATILYAIDLIRQRGRDTASVGSAGTFRLQSGTTATQATKDAERLLSNYVRRL